MQRLIKLSDTHYIVVDDSEIKEGDYYWNKHIPDEIKFKKEKGVLFNHCKKITHSTEPLELSTSHINTGKYHFDKIKPISLSEVEELINGYSVEKMALNSFGHKPSKDDTDILLSLGKGYVGGYHQGFKAHQELVKDKLLVNIQDLRKVILQARIREGEQPKYSFDEIIQSLLPKTEWDCEINEQGKLEMI
jgi:hypothetical protein